MNHNELQKNNKITKFCKCPWINIDDSPFPEMFRYTKSVKKSATGSSHGLQSNFP